MISRDKLDEFNTRYRQLKREEWLELFFSFDELEAENKRLREALEKIVNECNCLMEHGGEEWCDHDEIAKAALEGKECSEK